MSLSKVKAADCQSICRIQDLWEWKKWSYSETSASGLRSEVHYVRDPKTGALSDFKFESITPRRTSDVRGIGMRVRCVTNDLRALHKQSVEARLRRSIHLDGTLDDLTIGSVYSVIAVHESDGGIWVMLHTVDESDYPYPYPVEMFDVIDGSLPAGWCIRFADRPDGAFITRISFREWATDDRFYERLLDGDEATVAVYRRERGKLTEPGSRS
jgi:hypothetical protein